MPGNNTSTNTSIREDALKLEQLAGFALEEAKARGASAGEAGVEVSKGIEITVRMGNTDTVKHIHDKELEVTVFFGHQQGSASTTDFQHKAIRETVHAACRIAKYTDEDNAKGLPDPQLLERNPQELDLYHPWDLSVAEAIDLALNTDQIARDCDSRISNSEDTIVSSYVDLEVLANSDGFLASKAATEHDIDCSVIASDDNGMRSGSWYTNARNAEDLLDPESIGRIAAERACQRLAGRQIKSMKTPVIFEASIASSLLSHLVSAISGGEQYHKASFLLDAVGKQVFPASVRIHEQPMLQGAMGRSSSYDNEGVSTQTRDLVSDGILQSYVLNSYTARKLGLTTTGNCGGVRNLSIDSSGQNIAQLLNDMDTGLLVTELMGSSVNIVTGDYSRGASGFWIEGGKIQYAVEEITVAGNLMDMFKSIVAVGNDVDKRRNLLSGSIMLGDLAVAGN